MGTGPSNGVLQRLSKIWSESPQFPCHPQVQSKPCRAAAARRSTTPYPFCLSKGMGLGESVPGILCVARGSALGKHPSPQEVRSRGKEPRAHPVAERADWAK
jgi:hypothetical protein